MGRRAAKAGQIALPPVEVFELVDGAPTREPAKLRERSGWLSSLVGLDRSRFVISAQLAPELFKWREHFTLLEIDATGRPVLYVLPGMSGELRIGVSRMTVAQMLADPALVDATIGGARLPLPFGARLRIHCGAATFVARIGGPPLVHTPAPAAGSAAPLFALSF